MGLFCTSFSCEGTLCTVRPRPFPLRGFVGALGEIFFRFPLLPIGLSSVVLLGCFLALEICSLVRTFLLLPLFECLFPPDFGATVSGEPTIPPLCLTFDTDFGRMLGGRPLGCTKFLPTPPLGLLTLFPPLTIIWPRPDSWALLLTTFLAERFRNDAGRLLSGVPCPEGETETQFLEHSLHSAAMIFLQVSLSLTLHPTACSMPHWGPCPCL